MSALAGDDYLAFCEGLREICGIDLTQYKRPQMERRLRSFFARKGFERLTDGLKDCAATARSSTRCSTG
jgi:chemotaxis protein methyltransferase CheR